MIEKLKKKQKIQLHIEMDIRRINHNAAGYSPTGEEARDGAQHFNFNAVNYSSCYATSHVCTVKKGKALESKGNKRLQRNFRAPHYTLPLGIF